MQCLESVPDIVVVDVRMVALPPKQCVERHLDHVRPYPFFDKLVDHYCKGPVMVVVCAGPHAVARVRRAVVEDFRLRHCSHPGRSLMHASDSVDSARQEIENWMHA